MGVRTFRKPDPVIHEADQANKILGMLDVLSCGVRRDISRIKGREKGEEERAKAGIWVSGAGWKLGEEELRVQKLHSSRASKPQITTFSFPNPRPPQTSFLPHGSTEIERSEVVEHTQYHYTPRSIITSHILFTA
jgi:hypothetical protein